MFSKNFFWSVAIVATLLVAAPAFAGSYWSLEYGRTANGTPACYAYTRMNKGGVLGLGITARTQELFVYIEKRSWSIPPDQEMDVDLTIDGDPINYGPWRRDINLSYSIHLDIPQDYVPEFVRQFTEGGQMNIRFPMLSFTRNPGVT